MRHRFCPIEKRNGQDTLYRIEFAIAINLFLKPFSFLFVNNPWRLFVIQEVIRNRLHEESLPTGIICFTTYSIIEFEKEVSFLLINLAVSIKYLAKSADLILINLAISKNLFFQLLEIYHFGSCVVCSRNTSYKSLYRGRNLFSILIQMAKKLLLSTIYLTIRADFFNQPLAFLFINNARRFLVV